MTEGKPKPKVLKNMADVMADPDLAQFADDVAPLMANEKTIPYQKSYLLAQQAIISKKLEHLHRENYAISLKTALATILNDLPENISSPLLIELTNFTITYWEKLPLPAATSTSG